MEKFYPRPLKALSRLYFKARLSKALTDKGFRGSIEVIHHILKNAFPANPCPVRFLAGQ
jgi:hypothetical protein